MSRRWLGPLITILIVGGVAGILLLNLQPAGPTPTPTGRPGEGPAPSRNQAQAPSADGPSPASSAARPAGFREYPIGDDVERHHIRIAAVWLPPVEVEGLTGPGGSDVIHLEADVHATQGNPNGFGKGEFVPYLKIRYRIEPASGQDGTPIAGDLMPMVAADGLHYGASVSLPKPGRYRLTYEVQPPSAGGLGRHHDPITGVAPWWTPFEVSYDWDYPGPQGRAGGG